MNSQTLISVIVFWFAALCFTRVVSDDNDSILVQSKKLELVKQLNTLVRHSGWRSLNYVKIQKLGDYVSTIEDPMSVILEAVLSQRDPVDEYNVQERYDEIFTVLKCKYAEVILKFRSLVTHFIRVCRNEKTKCRSTPTNYTLQIYYDCFRLLLIKIYSISPRFQCMTDALRFIQSLSLKYERKSCITAAAEKLTIYTYTVGPRTSSRLSEHGINEQAVDLEMKTISKSLHEIMSSHLNAFPRQSCNIPSYGYKSAEILKEDFESKKRDKLIPENATLVQHLRDEMDCYISDILDSCFFDLGFAYDLSRNVIIRNN